MFAFVRSPYCLQLFLMTLLLKVLATSYDFLVMFAYLDTSNYEGEHPHDRHYNEHVYKDTSQDGYRFVT